MTIHTAIAAPLGAIALERLVIILGQAPNFEQALAITADEDEYYDQLAEQDLELTLAQAGMPS